MKAAVLEDFGGVENFEIKEVETPGIEPNEVLVQVKYISINPVETIIRAGMAFTEAYENRDSKILGWDISGIIIKKGAKVNDFEEGDEVFGMVNFPNPANAYAEYVAAPVEHLALKPSNISHQEAAGGCLAALTAWQGLTQYGNLQKGQKVLIQAASGGVGHYAVQIAKHWNAYVIGTSSGGNRDFVLQLGADEHIDYKFQKFEEVVKEVDLVLDAVGSENSYRSLDALKKGGKVVSLLAIATDLPEKARIQGKEGEIMMVQPSGKDMEEMANLLQKGAVKTYIDKAYSLEEIGKAHQHLESRRTKGKVVVNVT